MISLNQQPISLPRRAVAVGSIPGIFLVFTTGFSHARCAFLGTYALGVLCTRQVAKLSIGGRVPQ
jgi:hypothetical protein